jgi:hypothetical protein
LGNKDQRSDMNGGLIKMESLNNGSESWQRSGHDGDVR